MIHPASAYFTSYLNIALGLVFEMTPSSCHTCNPKRFPFSYALPGYLTNTIRLWPTEVHRASHPCINLNWIACSTIIYQQLHCHVRIMVPSGKGTAPVRKMTTWLTLSASCECSCGPTSTQQFTKQTKYEGQT